MKLNIIKQCSEKKGKMRMKNKFFDVFLLFDQKLENQKIFKYLISKYDLHKLYEQFINIIVEMI